MTPQGTLDGKFRPDMDARFWGVDNMLPNEIIPLSDDPQQQTEIN